MILSTMKKILLVVLITLVSACATNSDNIDTKAENTSQATSYTKEAARTVNNIKDKKEAQVAKEKLVCQTVKVVGSNIPKRICRTKKELEDAKNNTKDVLDSVIREQETFESPVPIG